MRWQHPQILLEKEEEVDPLQDAEDWNTAARPNSNLCVLLFTGLRSCVKVEVAVLGSLSVIVLMVSMGVKQQ